MPLCPPEPGAMFACYLCGVNIEEGEEVVEILYGIRGRGPKSGRPMVVPDPQSEEGPVILHPQCTEEFFLEGSQFMKFCAGCGADIVGD